MKSRITATAVLGTALFAFGCTDAERSDSPLAPGISPTLSTTGVSAADQATLNALTRAVALALQDQGLRQRVKNDMRHSPFEEHKLELRSYLRGNSGGILLAKMAIATGQSREDLLANVNSIKPLEFYMPVEQHRVNWTGEDNLYVAGSLDPDIPEVVAYNLRGEPVALSGTIPPATPTLVLVPAETDFTRPIETGKFKNVRDQGGKSIGDWQPIGILCETCVEAPIYDEGGGGGGVGSGGGTPKVYTRGMRIEEFISHVRYTDPHEHWFAGRPNFYLLLAWTGSAGSDQIRKNIPSYVWATTWSGGPDNEKNRNWRYVDPNLSLFTWDTDIGTRIRVQCFEEDVGTKVEFTLTGTTERTVGGVKVTAGITGKFTIEDDDDDCGSGYIDLRDTNGQWYYIPDGRPDATTNTISPEYNGTSDLHWYGYGYQR